MTTNNSSEFNRGLQAAAAHCRGRQSAHELGSRAWLEAGKCASSILTCSEGCLAVHETAEKFVIAQAYNALVNGETDAAAKILENYMKPLLDRDAIEFKDEAKAFFTTAVPA